MTRLEVLLLARSEYRDMGLVSDQPPQGWPATEENGNGTVLHNFALLKYGDHEEMVITYGPSKDDPSVFEDWLVTE